MSVLVQRLSLDQKSFIASKDSECLFSSSTTQAIYSFFHYFICRLFCTIHKINLCNTHTITVTFNVEFAHFQVYNVCKFVSYLP